MSQTNNLIVLCVECNEKAKTDSIYLSEIIRRYYVLDNKTTIRYVYLGTKTKYNHSKTIKSIKNIIKNAESAHIIYCIDTDEISSDPDTIKLNEKIKEFCEQNSFQLCWFCRDIEEVMMHKQVHDNEKAKTARTFKTNDKLNKATKDTLSAKDPMHKYCSNILLILDEFLNRHK